MLGVKAANQPKYDSADDRSRFGRYYREDWQMVFMCVCAHGCIRSIVDMYLCVTHVGVEFVYDTCADAIASHLVVYGAMHLCV